MEIVEVTNAADTGTVRTLLAEYAASLDVDLGFQGFDAELQALPGDYVRPAGILLLAREGDDARGCVAIHAWQPPAIAELKRLYVRPAARGRQLGRILTKAAIAFARSANYTEVRLDTLPTMRTAQAMYMALGFRTIDAYRANPVPGTAYMALDLRS